MVKENKIPSGLQEKTLMPSKQALKTGYRYTATIFLLFFIIFLPGCMKERKATRNFLDLGEFSATCLPNGCKEIRDGAGRRMLLVPRGQRPPKGYEGDRIIEIPVRRVVAYSGYVVSLLKAIGVLESTLVGVTREREDWTIEEVSQGMKDGRITYVGEPNAVDYERLRAIRPDVVFTWDQSAIPKIEELGMAGVITSTAKAMDLDTRMRFVQFLALFFQREEAAGRYVARLRAAIARIRAMHLSPGRPPKVIWGDIYEKRVMVEPGDSWAAQIIQLAGGKYLFRDISGAS